MQHIFLYTDLKKIIIFQRDNLPCYKNHLKGIDMQGSNLWYDKK